MMSKPIALSKHFALIILVLAGVSGAAYGLHDAAAVRAPAIGSKPAGSSARRDSVAAEPVHRVMDEVGFLNAFDEKGLDDYLQGIDVESGVDVRFIFARDVGGNLESFALKRARALGLGREMNRRSLLFVYDVAGKRMRLEVGPGMEGMFPDGFVGFLMREQTAALFATDDRQKALVSTVRVVSHRLREAALGGTYNPRAVAFITNPVRLAAGAGATVRVPLGNHTRTFGERIATDEERAYFAPQPTVAGVFGRYMEWLRVGHYEPDVPMFTPQTQLLFRSLHIARPFADLILYSEYGHKYEIVERGDLAILFFTTTPLVSSHLFRRDSAGWRLDVAAEVQDTREFVGGPYTWGMVMMQDDYTRAFSDLYEDFGVLLIPKRFNYRPTPTRVLRAARGDNRPLPTRAAHDPVPGRIATIRPGGLARLLLPVARNSTEDFGYPTQTIDRLAVRRLLFARSYDTLDVVLSAYADSVVRDYRMEYRLFDAYAAFDVAVPSLEPLLTEWVRQRPRSAAALLARGTFLNAAGWDARGTKFARDTRREQFDKMNDYVRRAKVDFIAALRFSPNSIVAYRGLLRMRLDPKTARELLDQGLKIQPYSFRLRWSYMDNLLPRWGGSYRQMKRFAEESAPYAARNPRILALGGFVDRDKGQLLERDGHTADAIKAYSRALTFGDFCEFRYQRGVAYWRAKLYKAALEDLNTALAQCPQHADALYERSWVTYDLGFASSGTERSAYFAQSYDDIEMAVALDPTDSYYQRHLAFVRVNIPNFAPPPRP
ncbi:MAG: uncharacterized protein QOE68_174 [Thermoanaerobaculia bacterium]|nr:uncharacterized protein [Thermoanaerobaculia bacterium]